MDKITGTRSNCSAMRTHATKLTVHSSRADINAIGGWELSSYGVGRASGTFMRCAPQLRDFAWPLDAAPKHFQFAIIQLGAKPGISWLLFHSLVSVFTSLLLTDSQI